MTIYRDTSLLHPKFRRAFEGLAQDLIHCYETGRTKTRFEIFETFRDPMRQSDMLGKKTTKAGPFQSAHQFGLACDFVPVISPDEAIELGNRIGERVLPGWSWAASHDYAFLKARAPLFGLAMPIAWDPCHVEHPSWREISLAIKHIMK